jgi:hypothetical protein
MYDQLELEILEFRRDSIKVRQNLNKTKVCLKFKICAKSYNYALENLIHKNKLHFLLCEFVKKASLITGGVCKVENFKTNRLFGH